MRPWRWLPAILGVSAFVLAALPSAAEETHVTRIGDIEIVHAWTRATTGAEAAVYMELHNEGTAADRLVGAASDAADRMELHGATMRDGSMTSEPLGAMPIAAGGELELEPNAVFLKLIGLRGPLVEGEELVIDVVLEHAGRGPVHVEIGAADATQHSHAGHAH